jgi:FkbM family methyltransferase
MNSMTNIVVIERALDATPNKTVHVVGTGTTANVEESGLILEVGDPTAGTSRTEVGTITLDGVLSSLSIERLDVIKMDIEGAENSIFDTPSTSRSLGTARAIAVEVHDGTGPGLVRNRLRAEGYSYVGEVKRESTFFVSSIRALAARPDLVMRLYGLNVVTIVGRMLSAALRGRSASHASPFGIVHAAR